MSYRQPDPQEKVVCPNAASGRKYAPEKVYDGISPDGKRIPRGILTKHSHDPKWFSSRDECPYSGLPVEIVRDDKKDAPLTVYEDFIEIEFSNGIFYIPCFI